MGKDLKGKELGRGLCQRRDGMYAARRVAQNGRRLEKHFAKLEEARQWLADIEYEDRHGHLRAVTDMKVDDWFEYWMNNIICDRAPNTRRNYQERYLHNIKPVIGNMRISDVKPMHCKAVLNRMHADYAGSTIRQTFITMGTMLRAAVDNDIILKHPMDGVRYTKPVRSVSDIHFLTVDEQRKFLQVAKRSHNYRQYALLLETGLRTSEMIGLTWDSVDFGKHTLTVNKTLEYRHKTHIWRAGPPKTASSYRTIPLTDKAYQILKECYDERNSRKEAEELGEVLEYIDRRTGETMHLVMRDLVFVNFRTGMPAKNSSYDTHLYKLCDEAGIKRFCMHALRHTFATRSIEAGIRADQLKCLLGHSSIKTTMDRYVHNSDNSLEQAIKLLESHRAV